MVFIGFGKEEVVGGMENTLRGIFPNQIFTALPKAAPGRAASTSSYSIKLFSLNKTFQTIVYFSDN
ncbi:MAG: hypothetical protein SF097_08895 [Acidobacteriota bacterium]|nr:hypothetical protein [Acidobacteriota bacterium]